MKRTIIMRTFPNRCIHFLMRIVSQQQFTKKGNRKIDGGWGNVILVSLVIQWNVDISRTWFKVMVDKSPYCLYPVTLSVCIIVERYNEKVSQFSTYSDRYRREWMLTECLPILFAYYWFIFSVPPDISDQMTVSDVTVSEGENATLTCKAVGHPQPRIIWKREDGENIILKKSASSKNISQGKYWWDRHGRVAKWLIYCAK